MADQGLVTGARSWSASPPVTLAGALGLLLAARLIALAFNRTDLFFDEAQYWSWSLEPAFGYYSKPPLIAWIIGLATKACGHGEACVRAASPMLHTITPMLVYLTGRRLYSAEVGLWSAIAFATLPGVSFSASLISTDVPLLVCWAAALYAFAVLLAERSWWSAVVLGVAIGLGLNAKYSMIYFVLCAGLYLALTPGRRRLLREPRLWAALGLAALLIAPNLLWNATHSFATFGHTADNARWDGSLLHPAKMLEFLGAQLGVFGPVLFAVLSVLALRALRAHVPEPDRMLLFLSLPVLVLITAQALLSRAHANWAATAYVAATPLVVATLLNDRARGWAWLKASLALHVTAGLALALGLASADRLRLPFGLDPGARLLGWRDMGEVVGRELDKAQTAPAPFRAVLTDDRSLTASLIYYLRASDVPVLAWRAGAKPRDHYELTRPFRGGPEPVLLVSLFPTSPAITNRFAAAQSFAILDVPTGARSTRRLYLTSLTGYRRDVPAAGKGDR